MTLSAYDLHIETNDEGFVLGKSLLGAHLGSAAGSWREVRTDFSNLSLKRSVSLDKGVLFRPEAPVLSLTTRAEDYYPGVFGRLIRVRWKNDVLFVGTIKNSSVSSQAKREGKDVTNVTISAIGIVDEVNNFVLYNFSAPSQTVAQRIAAVKPANTVIHSYGVDIRVMAAKGQSSPTLLEALQDAADVAQARFYVNKYDELVMDATPAPEPAVLFSDDATDTNRVLYSNVNMQNGLANTITGIVVTAKSDQAQEKTFAVAEHPTANVTHEESYVVDVPVEQGALEAWAESFPLKGKVEQAPVSIQTEWQDGLSTIELTDQVDIKWKENGYRAGVKTITYDLSAMPANELRWNVTYDLFPGHLLGFNRVNAPSAVKNFTIGGVYLPEVNGYSPTQHVFYWQAPDVPNDFTHYEIRMTRNGLSNQPEKAPVGQNDGEQVVFIRKEDATPANYNIEGSNFNGFSATIGGLDQETNYWYSIWAVTANPDVRSPVVSGWSKTYLATPSAPQNFRVTPFPEGPNFPFQAMRFEWDNPESVAIRMSDYIITVSNTNPQPTLADEVATNALIPRWGMNEINGYGYSLNTTFYFAIRAKNALGWYGPAAYAASSTQEAIPSPVRNVRTTVNAYNSITLNWDAPLTTGALAWYLVRWDFGGAPGLNTGRLWTRVPSTTRSLTFNSEGNTTYGFTVWPQTVGLRYGTSGSTVVTTPTGIFNKYWEGEAVWSQSYRSNNQFSSLARGNNIDMYYGYGDSFNGNQRSMAGFNIPANVTGAYAIDRVELHLYNKHTWYNTGADVQFGTHTWTTKPGTFQQSGANQATYRLNKPGWLHVDATWWLANSLRNGAKGITLGPGPNNSYNYYGFAAGAGGPRPVIKVWYRTIGS